MHFIKLTFRMLVNIHFQKYNLYKFGKLFIPIVTVQIAFQRFDTVILLRMYVD